MPTTMPVELYTDGSSLRNPGASGLAYLIRYWESEDEDSMPVDSVIEGSQGFFYSTNNRMEILATVYGLNKLIECVENHILTDVRQINLYSDSEYVVKANNMKWLSKWQSNNWMTAGYNNTKPQPVKNRDLWEQLLDVENKIRSLGINLVFSHVQGHSGNEWNERCDKMAVAASNNATTHIHDDVYEKLTGRAN